MSDMNASVTENANGFQVCGYEKIEYDFEFLDGVFDTANGNLANCYRVWNRCLAVMDHNIHTLYGERIEGYFAHHGLELRIHKTMIGEKAKNMETLLAIVDTMTDFGIYRKEPVLVVGGGLVTDVAGFACAAYRRNTNYIRIPTTVIGLIDASVSIKVAVNYGQYKNRLGAYHAPMHTFLDFTFLRTLPISQIRNGFAELIKISSCAHKDTYDLLEKHCEDLINTGFGRADGASKELIATADKICRAGIFEMLKLESPNLHEIMLDRVIAYGHTWSPLHELVPEPPLRHGHAISIDMAYSATLSRLRGLITAEEHMRLLMLFSRAGLSMDHPQFDTAVLEKATAAILKTRDGKLRAAVPVTPMGTCVFLNDVSKEELAAALESHKALMNKFARRGAGIDAFVDASDTGYTVQGETTTLSNGRAPAAVDFVADEQKLNGNGNLSSDGFKSGSNHGTAMDGLIDQRQAIKVVDGGSS
ncbi:2-epi-5-epi-valiolone synthase [Verticillium alfalfae VaMs.102]|uniref:2-epi-5-epi-valiolone synthase n=1 Tax=Verticillium alfalfae (strain VaMs.102 / ATCC MYA-4576 / FGSC 10136) TaxID=526221 RepID=C9SUJ9_VERA1|nr:2-epi-5-epi-valiolone synthase [Verticillium alfalfae VaMs.102]EEY22510.1 2-epi-5-epi-valiolone synthase [Verticillium alfalfae VaMs.102]